MEDKTKLSKRQIQVFSAYTGCQFGDYKYFLEYAEELLDRKIQFHEFSNKSLMNQLHKLSEKEFKSMVSIDTEKSNINGIS